MCRSMTQRKNTSFNTSFDSMALSTDTDGTTETDNIKPCYFVTHPEPIISSTLNLRFGQEVPKTLISSPLAHFFFDDRAADGRKHSAKMREPKT